MNLTTEQVEALLESSENTEALTSAINDHLSREPESRQYTLEDVRRMRPTEIERARESGRLADLLSQGGRR